MFNPNSTVDPTLVWNLLGSFYRLLDSDSKELMEAYWTGIVNGIEGLFYDLSQAHLSLYLDKTPGYIEHAYETFDFRFSGLDPNYSSRIYYETPDISGSPTTPSSDDELYSYVVTAVHSDGTETTPSLPALIISGGSNLVTNPNLLSWDAVSGISLYNIYGRTQNNYYLLAENEAGLTYSDIGGTLGTTIPPDTNGAIESFLFDLPVNRKYLSMPVLSGIDSDQQLLENTNFTIEQLTKIKFLNDLSSTTTGGSITTTIPKTGEVSLKVLNPTSLTTIPSLTSIYFPAFGEEDSPDSILTEELYTPHLSGYYAGITSYHDKRTMYGTHLTKWTHALVSGLRAAPTLVNITNVSSLLYNLPFSYYSGTVSDITLDGAYNYVTVTAVDAANTACYRIPSGLYLKYEVDDAVGQYNILCSGIQVDDYLNNATTISGLMTKEGSTTELDVFVHQKGGARPRYHIAQSVEEDTVTAPLTSPIIINAEGGKNG